MQNKSCPVEANRSEAQHPEEEEQLKLEGMHSSKAWCIGSSGSSRWPAQAQVQELENRVAAALRAAYDRSARIKAHGQQRLRLKWSTLLPGHPARSLRTR